MRVLISVLFGIVSVIAGTMCAFFNPGIGVVVSISIIGAGIIYDHAFPRKAPTRNETRLVLPQ